jgi:LPS export ABC transporter protein LptC
MRIKKKYLLFIIMGIYLLLNCKTERDAKQENNTKYPNLVQTNYTHYIFKNRKKYLYTKMDKAEFFEKQKIINCTNIKVEIYDSKEKLTTKIESEESVVDNNNKKLVFTKNVILEIVDKKTKLYADEIDLDYENNRLKCIGKIVMKKDDGSYLTADSMESDVKLDTTKFENMEIKYFYDEDKKK